MMKRRAKSKIPKLPIICLLSFTWSGLKIKWIAPSGGRDRPDPATKEWFLGLVDAGVTKIPRMFVHKEAHLHQTPGSEEFTFPNIDFKCIDCDATLRSKVIEELEMLV
ncbi:hypothetical protein AgCh_011586 [Apium graveolens]